MRALVLVLLVACASPAPPPPAAVPPPRPVGLDAGTPCAKACLKRESLGCLEPELKDSCVPVCERAVAVGFFSPTCVLDAKDREALTACRIRCR